MKCSSKFRRVECSGQQQAVDFCDYLANSNNTSGQGTNQTAKIAVNSSATTKGPSMESFILRLILILGHGRDVWSPSTRSTIDIYVSKHCKIRTSAYNWLSPVTLWGIGSQSESPLAHRGILICF